MAYRVSDKPPEKHGAGWERINRKANERLAKAQNADLIQPSSPAKLAEREQLLLPLEGKRFKDKVEAAAKVRDAHPPGEGLKAEKIIPTSWEPSATEQREILARVDNRKEWANRKIEGLGVEGTIYYLEKSGEYTNFVRLGRPNRADVLCVDRQSRLVVVECKGHTAQGAADTGRFNKQGEASGSLASKHHGEQLKLFGDSDKQLFENSSEWLEDNREYMQKDLQERINANSADRGSCERVLEAMKRTDFTDLNSYQRVVGTVGPEARFGNVEDFIKKVKPKKMIEVKMKLLESDT